MRLARLSEPHLSRDLVAAAQRGLRGLGGLSGLARQRFAGPAARRLAFRELGLAIGLAAPLDGLAPYRALRDELVGFWSDPANRDNETFAAHRDINEVMLASSLVPEGVLELPSTTVRTM